MVWYKSSGFKFHRKEVRGQRLEEFGGGLWVEFNRKDAKNAKDIYFANIAPSRLCLRRHRSAVKVFFPLYSVQNLCIPLERFTREAYDQGTLLTYEDIAMILTTSLTTVKRDIHFLKKQGKFIMTQGAKDDMGVKTGIADYPIQVFLLYCSDLSWSPNTGILCFINI